MLPLHSSYIFHRISIPISIGSTYFGAVISAQLHDPSHHFNEKYMYGHNVFLDMCCARPCGTLRGFLPAL